MSTIAPTTKPKRGRPRKAKPEEAKPEEAKPEEAKPEEAKPEEAKIPLSVFETHPFKMHSISVDGKVLHHDQILRVAHYYLTAHKKYMKECLRINMARQAALGVEFTAQDWGDALDEPADKSLVNTPV
jgi:hypothetical protein